MANKSVASTNVEKSNKAKYTSFYEGNNTNRFADLIFRLYDACYIKQPDGFKIRFHKPMTVNIERFKILKEAEEMINTLANESPDFDTLYDFASFIKYMEKVYFIKNDETCFICCDSQLEERNTRKLIFSGEDLRITCNMKLMDNTIEIVTSRLFGRNMEYGFKIVDREVEFHGKSDAALMNNIVLIMQDQISEYFKEIVIAVVNGRIGLHSYEVGINHRHCHDLCDAVDDYWSISYDSIAKTREYKNILYLLKKGYISA